MKQNILLYPPELASEFIAEQEGFRPMAYKCPAGVWTIGFGHTKGVQPGDLIIKSQAYELLDNDLKQTQDELATLIHVPVSKNQFIALMSFVYNFGLTKCRNYTLFKHINAEDIEAVKTWWIKYRNPGSEFEDGLLRRRQRELALFLSGS